MDEIRLESYSKALVEAFPDDADTMTVLDRLSLERRQEFETIIPTKGDLIVLVKREGWARNRIAREAQEAANERAEAEKIAAERAAGTFTHLDLGKAITEALEKKAQKAEQERLDRAYKPTVTECPHCGCRSAPLTSQEAQQLARFYTLKAERLVESEAKLGATPEAIEGLGAEYKSRRDEDHQHSPVDVQGLDRADGATLVPKESGLSRESS